jgi:DNA primase
LSDERDLVRSRTDIVELVGQRVILKRAGKNFSGLCPFHQDKNPSFSVDPLTGRYRCWSCGESGDVFTWVMKTESVEFAEALQILAKRAGVDLGRRGKPEDVGERGQLLDAMQEAHNYFKAQLLESRVATDYVLGRGISRDVISKWQLGFAPNNGEGLVNRLRKAGLPLPLCKELFLIDDDRSGGYYDKFRNRLMFPIFDERSQLVGFGGRVLGDGTPKYINSSDTKLYRKSKVLYGLHHAKETLGKTRKAILVEGYLDVIACHTSGASGAVASLGTALAEDHAKLLKRFADEVSILYDHDAAGQKAAERAIGILQTEGLRVKIVNVPDGDDPDTLLRRDGPEAVLVAIAAAVSPTAFRLQRLEEIIPPSEDRFWIDAVEILSDAPEDLESEGHLLRLAGMYPHIRDVNVALTRLTQMAANARRAKKKPGTRATPRAREPAATLRAEPMQAAESILFGALHEPKFQKFAWIALQTPELLATGPAIQLAEAVREAFPSSPPEGPPIGWIHRVEPEEMRRLLSDVNQSFHIDHLSETFVVDSITRLRNQAIDRELRRLRRGSLSAEDRQEVLRRLKILKPDARAAADEEDDPFS